MSTLEIVSYTDCETIELTWEVTYSMFGKHLPATRFEPEENPELEIEKIELKEASIYFEIGKGYRKSILSLIKEDKSWLEELETTIDANELEVKCWEDADKEAKYNDEDAYY